MKEKSEKFVQQPDDTHFYYHNVDTLHTCQIKESV